VAREEAAVSIGSRMEEEEVKEDMPAMTS